MAGPTIVVLIKQVPDMDQVKFDYEKGRIDRGSASLEPNPFDLNALEEAVTYKEEVGGEVIAISMGPKQVESTLREALARGADKAILLSDSGFAGSDTWATSACLGTAIAQLNSYDLIICGEKTVDGDTGQVGPEVAEYLSIPHVAYVSKVRQRATDYLKVESQAWGKVFVKKLRLPGLITVTKDLNQPRLPSFTNKMKARNADIKVWGMEDIGGKPEDFGIKGSPTRVANTEVPPPLRREAQIFRDGPAKAASKLLEELKKRVIG